MNRLLAAALRRLTRLIYRLEIVGVEHVPANGPALLIANHLSLADGMLVGAAVPRRVRFLVWKEYYEDPKFRWLMKRMKAIPISDQESGRDIMRSLMYARKALEEGDVVCLFAEGQISRTGNLLQFKRGFEVMIKGTDVPVIPVHLDRVWGSIFSFEHGKVIFKKPRQIPYPVTVTFGPPVAKPVTAPTARQAILDLGADAFRLRLRGMRSLPVEFLKRAHRQPRVMAAADTSGREVTFGSLAAASHVLSEKLAPLLSTAPNVGLLLPSSVGGVLANIALSFLGKVPVNLNYTSGEKTLSLCIERAGIERMITSRKLLEKTGLTERPGMLFLEDVAKTMSKGRIARARVMMSLWPVESLIRRWIQCPQIPIDEMATILFSSGSTGVPKGVMLSHANILSNVLSLSQIFDVGPKDRMIGVLPFFHSFGFTATFWFPLIAGFAGVYHSNPLEAKLIGDLSKKYGATLLLATPTFLSAYIRKCTPEQFSHLRFVITGAERLRDTLSKAFVDKFGALPLEGYGCTELSPVVAASVPNVTMGDISQVGHKPGKIGQPIPGVSVKIVDPSTFAPLGEGEKGLLLVRGPNVMQGYLGDPQKTAEAMHDGWYVTGDIAFVDADGFIEIVDRLSRFSKIGGEMVPHILIEEKLQSLSGSQEPVFAVSSLPDEKKGERLVVLFVEGANLNIEKIYGELKSSGLANLWIPGREMFFPVEAIPVLGTGKVDLAKLKQTAKEKAAAK